MPTRTAYPDLTRRGDSSRVRTLVDAWLARAGLFSLRRWPRDAVAVLAYHGVPDRIRFAEHLDVLQNHYTILDPDAFLAALERERGLPARSVLLTFDDGDPSVFDHALPELVARSLQAVVFAVAGYVGTSHPFWWDEVTEYLRLGVALAALPTDAATLIRDMKRWPNGRRNEELQRLREQAGFTVRARQLTIDQLRALQEAGMEIGNHSLTHPCLNHCGDEVIEHEIGAAHERLKSLLGTPPRMLAYPNGDRDGRCIEHARLLEYQAGFVFDHRIARLQTNPRLELSRLRIDATADPQRLLSIVTGLHPTLHHMRPRTT